MWKNKSLRLLRCVIFVDISIHGIRKEILEAGIIAILLDSTGDRHISPKEFKIPVIFHNLLGYDSHFIMQEIGSIGEKQ